MMRNLKMTPERRDICIHITKKLMTYPCAALFLNPVNPNDAPKYREIIQYPQDLSTILHNLEKGIYHYVDNWEKDMKLIWYNAEKYNGSQSDIYILSQCLAEHFQKKIKILDNSHLNLWVSNSYNDAKSLMTISSTLPPSLASKLPQEMIMESIDRPISDAELKALEKALSFLTKSSQKHYIFELLNHYESKNPSFDMYSPIDLRSLSKETLFALQLFAQEQFRKDNRPYPTSYLASN